MSAVPTKVDCPECGRPMKLGDLNDLAACRCGLFCDLDGRGAPVPPFRKGEAWKERDPGILVSDEFRDIAERSWEIARIDPAKVADKAALERACADAFEAGGLRYKHRARADGDRKLILETGETLERHRVYALVPLGQEAEAIRQMVQFIANKHGTGHVWAIGEVPIGPLRKRVETEYRGAEIGGVLHAVLGCYYFHKPIN